MRLNTAAACALVFAVTAFAYAADLVWTGAADGKWGSGINWTNGAGAALSFASGDNARFGDSASVRSVNLSATLTAGDILFEGDQAYTLTNAAGGKIASARAFVKRGSGTLFLSCYGHSFTNDVRIEGGRVVTVQPNTTSNSPLGLATVARQIYVSTNATLRLSERNTFGAADLTNLLAEVFVDQGGLLELGYFGAANKGVNTLGSLTLREAALSYTNLMGNTSYGFLKVCQTFRLLGTQPYVFSRYGNNGCLMLLNSAPHTTFDVADITGDASPDATFGFPFKDYSAAMPGGLRKTGPGTMMLTYADSSFTGNIAVREGELVAAAARGDANNAVTVLGNARVSRSIYVSTNAVLTFAERNTLGAADAANPLVAVTVDHGALNITTNGHTVFGDLTLDNGALTYKSGLDATRGVIRLGGKLALKGTAPYAFGIPAGATNCFINLNAAPPTEINVAEITGTAAADATFQIPFKDFASNVICAAGFVKTGPGTLSLTNKESTFTGDVEIREGTVTLFPNDWGNDSGYSPLGNPVVERRVTVSTNATLVLRQRNSFSSAAASSKLKVEVYVDHGLLQLGDTNVVKGVNTVGSLTLNDGTLSYTNMFSDPYGFLKVARVFRLQGTLPYAFAGSSLAGCYMILNASPTTVFDVADITGDSAPDATFGFPFKNHPSSTCGLIKSGAGTMRVTATSAYTGETLVSNGVLQVDGNLGASSQLTVAAGGWLGGTGTVKNVAFEAGGGFDGVQGQSRPLAVTGSLTLEGAGTVHIQNPDGLPGRQIQVVLADVAGTVSGAEYADGWTVAIDGVASSVNYRMRVIGTRVVAGYAPRGTLVSLR